MGQRRSTDSRKRARRARPEDADDQPSQTELAGMTGHARAKAIVARRERERAAVLNEALLEPEPNEAVRQLQAKAAFERRTANRQRDLASVAVSQPKKREFLSAARKADDRARMHDRDAAAARQRQLDEHWASRAIAETIDLAVLRGMAMTEETTVVADWVREDDGSLARDDKGLPKQRVEEAKARRTNPRALELLRNRDVLTRTMYETGIWYGQLCADAAVAELHGREETGLPSQPSALAPKGPGKGRLAAVSRLRLANQAVIAALGPDAGGDMLALLIQVCHFGMTPRDLTDDHRKSLRMEGKVPTGLAILRHHQHCRVKEAIEARKSGSEEHEPGVPKVSTVDLVAAALAKLA